MNAADAPFVVALGEFEGPLDLLLDLARAQRVDLGRISVLALAEQYLAYLERVGAGELPVAAEYLVMAAWLAYLKSQLLLPRVERDEPNAEALAATLEERLRRLEALRRAGAWLTSRPTLGQTRLPRGAPEPPPTAPAEWRPDLASLLGAYRALTARNSTLTMTVPPRELWSVDAALRRFATLLTGQGWRALEAFLPEHLAQGVGRRSGVAASLVACLELAREGRIELRQAAPFGPITVRARA